jgi:hypothetical protein
VSYFRYSQRISGLLVLKNDEGFYIGRIALDPDGIHEPYSKESNYFNTREEAESHLVTLQGEGSDNDGIG